jgi:oxygen-dependent protoporphyrinogen oxidase
VRGVRGREAAGAFSRRGVVVSGGGVAVVGSGAAGLAAAWRLASRGRRVVLYERHDLPGGLMRSDVVEGAVVDVGAQMFASTYTSTIRLAREVGVGSMLVRAPGRDALWRKGRPHPFTYGSVASMAASAALPARLKLRLLSTYLPFLATRCRGLDANDPAGTGGEHHDDESVAEWGRREMGDDFVEYMAYPFLGAYHGAVPEQTSAAFYHSLARVGMDVKLYAMMGGMGSLAFAVVDGVEARGGQFGAGRAVGRVEPGPDGVALHFDNGDVIEHEAAVIAVPAAAAIGLLSGSTELAAWLGRVEATPFVTVAVVTDRPIRSDWFGLGFPRTELPGDRIVVACSEASKAAGIVPAGRGLVVAFPAPMIVPGLLAGPADTIPGEVLSALDHALGSVTDSAVVVKAWRHPEGHTRFQPGHIRHVQQFREDWLPGRVAIAGDYLVAPTVEGAVVSGERAADRVIGG